MKSTTPPHYKVTRFCINCYHYLNNRGDATSEYCMKHKRYVDAYGECYDWEAA
jgi:hypothetical protein